MPKKVLLFVLSALSIILASSCKKDGEQAPVSTVNATEITANSAILTGQVNPEDLKDSKEIGFFISQTDDPESGAGTKYVATVVDKNNKFSVGLTDLKPATKYYYVAFMTVGAANYVGKTKSFTTEAKNGNDNADDDEGPIKIGRWDAYEEDNNIQLKYALVFGKGNTVVQYDFCEGDRIEGTYSLANNRLTINDVKWLMPNCEWSEANQYTYIDPQTLAILKGDWITMDNGTVNYLKSYFGWWLDRQFILDSPTTAHGEGWVYKFIK
ncbi:MAG: fibronectin type III domain-containing protein [Bacteroidales bacterium]|nr:fibronectin type III domain-containing protein [Bacteroidales bacterium]